MTWCQLRLLKAIALWSSIDSIIEIWYCPNQLHIGVFVRNEKAILANRNYLLLSPKVPKSLRVQNVRFRQATDKPVVAKRRR